MNAIILHDLAHISAAGYGFFLDSASAHASAVQSGAYIGGFYPSKWSENVETFANDVMTTVAANLSIDITIPNGPVIPGGKINSVIASSL